MESRIDYGWTRLAVSFRAAANTYRAKGHHTEGVVAIDAGR